MKRRIEIINAMVVAKYMIEPKELMRLKIRSTVNVYCSLFESRMITSVPVKTRIIAEMSYLGTNFSPSHIVDMKTFMSTADDELQAIKVKSQKGSATKWPREPTITRNNPQMPLREQKRFFYIVLSADAPILFRFSSSI